MPDNFGRASITGRDACATNRGRRPHIDFLPGSVLDLYDMNRQRIEKLVREHAANHRVRQGITGFNDAIGQIRCRRENVGAQLTAVAAEFDDCELRRITQFFAKAQKLLRQEFTEQRADADAGKIIASSADPFPPGGVIAVLRMIEGQFHEPVERDPAAGRVEFAADIAVQLRIAVHAPTITERRALMKSKE